LSSYLPVRSEMMWSLYEIIHIWTAVVDESEKWSSQLIFQFKQLERRSLKKSGLFLFSEMMWSLYEIIHIHVWTAVVDESEKMIIAVNFPI